MKFEPQGSVFGGYGFMTYAARRRPFDASANVAGSVPRSPGRLRQLANRLLGRLQRR